jgi:hypothetical protein
LAAFAVLLVAAIRKRRESAKHLRLLAFASVAIVGPAFARFAFWKLFGASGAAGGPLFAMSGMLLIMLGVVGYDLGTRRKIQPATVAGVAAVMGSLIVGVGAGATGTGFRLIQRLHAAASPVTADVDAATR